MTPLRTLLPAFFFAIWFCAVGVMHFRLAGPRSTYYLEAGRKIALIRGDYHPPRARLLDADHVPLAWSERYFDLIWQEPTAPPTGTLRKLAAELALPMELEADGQNWILHRDLTPEELLKTAPVLQKHPALLVRSRLERIAVNIPEVREKIGMTELRQGALQGISGWELQYDAQLRGTPGRYEVMLDRRRRWIDSTWNLITPAIPGRDVRVPFRLEEAK